MPDFWYGCIDRIKAAIGQTHSVHGEVRSHFDHLLNLVGMQNGLIALLEHPDHTRELMDTFTQMEIAWAVAQVRRGCDAIKISSPYGGAGFLSRDQYQEWVAPYEKRVATAIRGEGAFAYDHTCGAIGDRLDLMADIGIHGIETLDPPPLGTVELQAAKELLRDHLFIKSNVDPVNTSFCPHVSVLSRLASACSYWPIFHLASGARSATLGYLYIRTFPPIVPAA